jgi:3-phosphoshikimate 1-carboxyvinyltransferase
LKVEILPQSNLRREQNTSRSISIPPDKSIFHRLLIIGSLTESRISIAIPSIEEIPADVFATILALESLGVQIDISRSEIILQGVGLNGFHAPKHKINCANSGTTARLMMGLLAGQDFSSTLTGDESLTRRPMKRLSDILNSELGANIVTSANGTMPIVIEGKHLHGGSINLPVASAQMKSASLIAGLFTQETVIVHEPKQSRDHTELMLAAFGADIEIDSTISIKPSPFSTPAEFSYTLTGDISSAAFLIGAAILEKRNIWFSSIGLNPTRTKFLDILKESGLLADISEIVDEQNEKRGKLEIFGWESKISKPFTIIEKDIPLIIDEIPLLAVLAAFCNGMTIFSHVGELRNKESDRISALVKNLRSFGVIAEEKEDGFMIEGDQSFIPKGGHIEHCGDHRIAMALSVLALRSQEKVTISEAEVVSVSYPNFYRDLGLIASKERIRIS